MTGLLFRRRRASTALRPVRRARSPGTDSARAVDDSRSGCASGPARARLPRRPRTCPPGAWAAWR